MAFNGPGGIGVNGLPEGEAALTAATIDGVAFALDAVAEDLQRAGIVAYATLRKSQGLHEFARALRDDVKVPE